MIDRYQKWNKLQLFEKTILLYAAVFLPVTSLKRRLGLYKFNHQPVESPKQTIQTIDASLSNARQIAQIVSMASALSLRRTSCLDRSLVLCTLLRWQGIDCALQIGVRTDQGRFEAHAWVETNGVPLNDQEDVNQRFSSFPGMIRTGS